MKGKYKRAKKYCPMCDKALVAIGKKCPECGHKVDKKQKKPTSAKIIKTTEQEL